MEEETLSRLDRLRFKPRTELKEGLVRAVLLQPLDDLEKIRKIEMIDLMSDEEEGASDGSRRPRGALLRPAKPEVSELPDLGPGTPPVHPREPTKPEVDQIRTQLFPRFRIGGWWKYLTKEYGPMVEFGARTSVLGRGFFPFTLRISSDAIGFLTKTLPQKILPGLEPSLSLIARKSWLHLTKYEYNLMVALRDLVRLIGQVEVDETDRTGGGHAWDPVFPALRLFWTDRDLVPKTLKAWDLATQKLGTPEAVRLGGVDSIRTLLEPRTDTMAFPEVLLGILMLRTRRMIAWEESPIEPGAYFLRDTFDCSSDVQTEIDRATRILEDQFDLLAKEAQEVRRIRYYLPPEDLLSRFDGGADRENKSLWCKGFIHRIDVAFSPVLEGTVTFTDGTQTDLFQNPSLSSILARLRLVEVQLSDGNSAGSPDLVAQTAKMIMNLGKTLVVLIRNRSLTADPLARSPDASQLTDPLPFEEGILDRPIDWEGLSVIDALVRMAQICLQAGRFLGETSLEMSLEKEVSLPRRANELLGRLGKLVPEGRLEVLRSRWTAQGLLLEND